MDFTSSSSSLPPLFSARSGRSGRLVVNKAKPPSSSVTTNNRRSKTTASLDRAAASFDPNTSVIAALPAQLGPTPLPPTNTLTNQFWARQLVQAFEQQRLELFLQPIVALPTSHSSSPLSSPLSSKPSRHYEVLLRMQYPAPTSSVTAPTKLTKKATTVGVGVSGGGFAPTLAVIQAAEYFGLMPRLDLWVILRTLHDSNLLLEIEEGLASNAAGSLSSLTTAASIAPSSSSISIQAQNPEPSQSVVTLAINLSASSVCNQDFEKAVLKELDNWLATTSVPAAATGGGVASSGCANSARSRSSKNMVRPIQICFELTELSCVTNWKQALHFMHSVRARGCKFAFDDAGSGWASFDYLRKLRSTLDYLKIDSSLVEAMLDDPLAYAMVKSLHQIAHLAGLKTIAEGASSDKIIRSLVGLGVDFGQGYALGRPMPWPTQAPM